MRADQHVTIFRDVDRGRQAGDQHERGGRLNRCSADEIRNPLTGRARGSCCARCTGCPGRSRRAGGTRFTGCTRCTRRTRFTGRTRRTRCTRRPSRGPCTFRENLVSFGRHDSFAPITRTYRLFGLFATHT